MSNETSADITVTIPADLVGDIAFALGGMAHSASRKVEEYSGEDRAFRKRWLSRREGYQKLLKELGHGSTE